MYFESLVQGGERSAVVGALVEKQSMLVLLRVQVVTAVNQQLGELAARKAELQHEASAAKERWQAEEAVRIRQVCAPMCMCMCMCM